MKKAIKQNKNFDENGKLSYGDVGVAEKEVPFWGYDGGTDGGEWEKRVLKLRVMEMEERQAKNENPTRWRADHYYYTA